MSDRLLSGPFLRTTAANLFFFLSFTTYFLLPLHLRAFGAGETAIGAVMGTAAFASLAALPFVGMTIDRWGRRAFLLFGAAGMALASVGFQLVDSVGVLLFALRFLQGVSFAAGTTATTTFAAEFAPRARRAQALGIFGLSTLVTHALGAALGEELVQRWGFAALFGLTTLSALVAIALTLTLHDRTPAERHAASVTEQRLRPAHWLLGGTMTLLGLGFGAVTTFIPTFMASEGLGRVGLFAVTYTSTAILARLVGAGLSDSFGRRQVIVPALAVFSVATLWIAGAHDLPGLLGAAALFGLAQGITYPTMHAYLIDLAAESQLGRSQALFNGAFHLGVGCSALAFGAVAEQFGYRAMYVAAAAMPLLGALVFAIGAERPTAVARR